MSLIPCLECDAGIRDDAGGTSAAYGAPPDAGVREDAGGIIPAYGAPPER